MSLWAPHRRTCPCGLHDELATVPSCTPPGRNYPLTMCQRPTCNPLPNLYGAHTHKNPSYQYISFVGPTWACWQGIHALHWLFRFMWRGITTSSAMPLQSKISGGTTYIADYRAHPPIAIAAKPFYLRINLGEDPVINLLLALCSRPLRGKKPIRSQIRKM